MFPLWPGFGAAPMTPAVRTCEWFHIECCCIYPCFSSIMAVALLLDDPWRALGSPMPRRHYRTPVHAIHSCCRCRGLSCPWYPTPARSSWMTSSSANDVAIIGSCGSLSAGNFLCRFCSAPVYVPQLHGLPLPDSSALNSGLLGSQPVCDTTP